MNIKKVVGISIGLVAIGLGIYRRLSGNEPPKYSNEWFESLSDEELDAEREKVRLDHCSGDAVAQTLLYAFNNAIRKRSNKGHENEKNKYSHYREHGWYLQNDD